ncbi:MAG: C39 family peptidase [Verrucomicrobiales bacterium]
MKRESESAPALPDTNPIGERFFFPLDMPWQPTDDTCGPTCLKAIYGYYGRKTSLQGVIDEIPRLENGGTLEVNLGVHALKAGFDALIYTYNLRLFDPTWFGSGSATRNVLLEKLEHQAKHRRSPKRQLAARAYLEFCKLGGSIKMEDLSVRLLSRHLRDGHPILCGLSATWLYRHAREHPKTCATDDLNGEPVGHFVVIHGYDPARKTALVADPHEGNPQETASYEVPMTRLITAALMGVLTYDSNLLVISPTKIT